ncbi:hypothetical protein BJX61DRAFT_338803 [Aspergillus egyptiacus]|nr:hypothetical protein BJX61DRAFT_338803 [Aspergillus egyptiacus]
MMDDGLNPQLLQVPSLGASPFPILESRDPRGRPSTSDSESLNPPSVPQSLTLQGSNDPRAVAPPRCLSFQFKGLLLSTPASLKPPDLLIADYQALPVRNNAPLLTPPSYSSATRPTIGPNSPLNLQCHHVASFTKGRSHSIIRQTARVILLFLGRT